MWLCVVYVWPNGVMAVDVVFVVDYVVIDVVIVVICICCDDCVHGELLVFRNYVIWFFVIKLVLLLLF